MSVYSWCMGKYVNTTAINVHKFYSQFSMDSPYLGRSYCLYYFSKHDTG